ncbi:hypothetical protein CPC08DRAFT_234971 [Agrocybe pediades]|nr:hypothetical protein CPC08DRAFT_234971 [Agrocybe pediades]
MSPFFRFKKLEIFASVMQALEKAKEKKDTLERVITLSNSKKPTFLSIHKAKRTQRRLQAIKQFISIHEARIAPCDVMRLPPELLSTIFELAIAQERWKDPCILPSLAFTFAEALPALVFSHVCAAWRGVAVSMPRVWQTLPIVELDKWTTGRLQFLEEILRRGKDLPLLMVHLYNYASNHGVLEIFQLQHPAIQILVKHSERWHSFTAWISDISAVMAQLAPIKGRISSLHRVELSVWGNYSESMPDCSIFEIAPNLRELDLRYVPFRLTLPTPLDVRKLKIVQYEASAPLIAISPLLSLSSSTITSLELYLGSPQNLSPTSLPNLISLKVNFLYSPSG